MEEILKFLENPKWLDGLNTDIFYDRQHDDTDGGIEGHLKVQFSSDGDAWIAIDGSPVLRFRNYFGGGRSLKTHAALMVLALAIKLDNEA